MGRQGRHVEDLSSAVQRHEVAHGVAQARQGHDVDFEQVLLVGPLLCQEGPIGTQARTVDQQVDAVLAFFQLEHETRDSQRFAQVTGTEQHLDAEPLGQFEGDGLQGFAVACHQNEVAPAPCQGLGQGQAQATGGAGDHGVTGHARLLGGEKSASVPRGQGRRWLLRST